MKCRKRYPITDIIVITVLALAIVIFIAVPFFHILKTALVQDGRLHIGLLLQTLTEKKQLIFNSLKLGIYTTLLTVGISICTALYVYMAKEKWRRILLLILGITMISPPFVTALTYISLFGRRGFISYRLLRLSLQPYGMWGIVFMQALSDFSLCSLLLYGSLKSIPKYLIDSAAGLGADTNHILTDILLSGMLPGIKAAAVLSFLRSLSDFGTPAIIGGNFNVLSLESYFAVIAEGNLPKAAALNLLILLLSLPVFIFYQNSLRNVSASTHGIYEPEIRLSRQGWIYRLCSVTALFFLLWISLQYASLFLSAFSKMREGKLVLSLDNIMESRQYIGTPLLRSITYSFIAAALGSVMGLLIGYYAQIRAVKIMKVLDFLATLPYVIPGTFFGLGYLISFHAPPLALTGTAAIVILNVVFKQLPFSGRMGNAAMETLSEDVLDSVRDLGGGQMHELKDAVFPLSREALALSFINAFTATMTTVGSIIFLVYPGQKVLTLVMFDVIQSGKYNIGAVLALLIIFICMAANGIYILLDKSIFKS